MIEQKESRHRRSIVGKLLAVVLPAIPFGLGVGYATGDYLASFVTGLAMAGTVKIFDDLDRAFFHPRLEGLPLHRREVVEIAFGLFYYILGMVLALLVCNRIFDFAIEGIVAWFSVLLAFAGFLLVQASSHVLHFHRALKEKEIREERLRALAAQAELKALKAQINPHFLFNTLNTVAALIHADPAQAEATVERLAEMLRYVMAAATRERVSLGEELSFVDAYLEIERARFGERLRVTREVTPEALDVPMPSLILQPLAENAVQHGQGADGSVDLTIRARPHGDEVVIAIADQGEGMRSRHKMEESQGVGLHNVDERLRKTYGEEYGLEIRDNEPQGSVVIIRIPVGVWSVGVWE